MMKYNRRTLISLLKLLKVKSAWGVPREKIPKNRKIMEKTGVVNLDRLKSNSSVSIEKFSSGGEVYYEMKPKGTEYNKVIYYTHGGAYVYEITKFHWELLEELCINTHSKIVVPIYPLTPENTKDTIFPWTYSLFKEILESERDKDFILMGDSAGGGLALAISLELRDEGITGVKAVILISPWIDITVNTDEMMRINEKDPLLDSSALAECGKYYIGDGIDDIISSPIKGDFTGIKNISVFTGTLDVLNPMAREFKRLCEEQSVNVNYNEYENSIHVFPLFRTEDGLKARNEMIDIVNRLNE